VANRPSPGTVKARFRNGLVARYFVRFHMGLILAATALSGLVFSKLLLVLGLVRMDIRYGICTLLSYGCFFLFVKMWLRYVGVLAERRSSRDDWDIGDLLPDFTPGRGSSSGGIGRFGGGASGGGGAGGSFETAIAVDAGTSEGVGEGAGKAVGSLLGGADLDDGLPLLLLALLVALVAAILGSAFYLVWSAPEILSEAAFQAALASGLVTRFRAIDSDSWEGSIFGKTVLPFVALLCLSVAFGHFAHRWRPEAVKISDIIGHNRPPIVAPANE
jgi:hypothetical protein